MRPVYVTVVFLLTSAAASPTRAGAPASATPAPKLLRAISRAPRFLVAGNRPPQFVLGAGREVDPGSTAHVGVDGAGAPVWVVDQKVQFANPPADLVGAFLHGFFTGKAAGPRGDDLRARLVSTRRAGTWSLAAGSDNTAIGLARSPFADPTIEAVVIHLDNVRPAGHAPGLKAGAMDLYIDMTSVVRHPEHAEFTVHFLNPDDREGPVPGTTDGAVRFRARRLANGSASVEGYYVTAAAREYLDPLSDFTTPVARAKDAARLGMKLWNATPVGWLTRPVTDLTLRTMTSAADHAIAATGAVQGAVATLHARYYREVLFPNLMR
jgi:hypothetical protein